MVTAETFGVPSGKPVTFVGGKFTLAPAGATRL